MERSIDLRAPRGLSAGKGSQLLAGLPLVLLPFLLGGARPWIWSSVECLFVTGALVLLWSSSQSDLMESLPMALIAAFGLLLLYPVLQSVPLPASVLGLLSPERFRWVQVGQELTGSKAQVTTISYTPHETFFSGLWLAFLAAYALFLRKLIREKKDPAWLLLILFCFAGFEAFYGILQALVPSLGVLWEAEGQGVASGTFVNRNHYAAFLGMIWPVLLAYSFTLGHGSGQSGVSSYMKSERNKQVQHKRIFFGFVMGLVLLALFFSRSRGGIGGALIALTVLVSFSGRMRSRSMIIFVIGTWSIMVLYGSMIGFDRIWQRFDMLGDSEFRRFKIWSAAWQMIKDHPITGTGLGTFESVYRVYQFHLDDVHYAKHAHNDYLQLAAELGLPVAVTIIALVWGYWIRTARRMMQYAKQAKEKAEGAIRKSRVRHGTSERRSRRSRLAAEGFERQERDARDSDKTDERHRVRVKRARRKSSGEDDRQLIAVGALAGSAAFLCHSLVEFNWQIPANALYFVMLLVLMDVGARGEKKL